MTREELIGHVGQGVVTITDPAIIKAAWGERRTSRKKRGMELNAYPTSVTAHHGLWLAWFDSVDREAEPVVVIAKKLAKARVKASMAPLEEPQATPVKLNDSEVQSLLAERLRLRADKQFEAADKIRDYLVAHGIQISDAKYGQNHIIFTAIASMDGKTYTF